MLNYMSGAKVECTSSGIYGLAPPIKTIATVSKYKKQLMTVLVKAEKPEHALYLCTQDISGNLPSGFLDSDSPIKKLSGVQFTSLCLFFIG